MKRFEDIIAWQRARELVRLSYTLAKTTQLCEDPDLKRQLLRATVSVMSNIAEGFESGSHVDFARFLTYARASCAEVRSQLYVAYDQRYLTEVQFQSAMDLARETKRWVDALRANLRPRNTVREDVVEYRVTSSTESTHSTPSTHSTHSTLSTHSTPSTHEHSQHS